MLRNFSMRRTLSPSSRSAWRTRSGGSSQADWMTRVLVRSPMSTRSSMEPVKRGGATPSTCRLTNVPLPRCRTTRLSCSRDANAWRTVMRLTPYSSARVSSLGTAAPGEYSPARIFFRRIVSSW